MVGIQYPRPDLGIQSQQHFVQPRLALVTSVTHYTKFLLWLNKCLQACASGSASRGRTYRVGKGRLSAMQIRQTLVNQPWDVPYHLCSSAKQITARTSKSKENTLFWKCKPPKWASELGSSENNILLWGPTKPTKKPRYVYGSLLCEVVCSSQLIFIIYGLWHEWIITYSVLTYIIHQQARAKKNPTEDLHSQGFPSYVILIELEN